MCGWWWTSIGSATDENGEVKLAMWITKTVTPRSPTRLAGEHNTSGGFRQAQPTPGRLWLTELEATTERSTERDEQNK